MIPLLLLLTYCFEPPRIDGDLEVEPSEGQDVGHEENGWDEEVLARNCNQCDDTQSLEQNLCPKEKIEMESYSRLWGDLRGVGAELLK